MYRLQRLLIKCWAQTCGFLWSEPGPPMLEVSQGPSPTGEVPTVPSTAPNLTAGSAACSLKTGTDGEEHEGHSPALASPRLSHPSSRESVSRETQARPHVWTRQAGLGERRRAPEGHQKRGNNPRSLLQNAEKEGWSQPEARRRRERKHQSRINQNGKQRVNREKRFLKPDKSLTILTKSTNILQDRQNKEGVGGDTHI